MTRRLVEIEPKVRARTEPIVRALRGMLVARAATRDAHVVASSRASRSRSRRTRVLRARHVIARGVSRERSDDTHIRLSVVARVPDAHAGAVLALAAVDDPDPDARFPWFISTSMDGTVSTWHIEERGSGDGVELVRDASFGDDDAPWWCLAVDDQWLFAGTHGRKVKVRLAMDADLEKLPGAIANHTGWVRALASVRKTPGEMERSRAPASTDTSAKRLTEDAPPPPMTGDAWRFSAACNVVRVWQDSFAFDEDDGGGATSGNAGGAVADVGSARIFTGDILCLAGVQTPPRGDRFLIAGVADGTLRGWRVCESRDAGERVVPVMRPIRERESDASDESDDDGFAEKVADLRGGRVAALFPLADAFPENDAWSHFVVAGCRDGTLGCVDAETLGVSPRVAAHGTERRENRGVACVCAGPGNTVASGGDDGIVRLWRARAAAPNANPAARRVACLAPAGSSAREDGHEGEPTKRNTRALCAVRDASGARVGVLAGDEAGGLTLYAPS